MTWNNWIIALAIAALPSSFVPAQARFVQTDPVGYQDDNDPYTYVGNDPTDLTDPTGLYQYTCETGSRIGCAQGFQTNQEKAIAKVQNAIEKLGNAIKDIKSVAVAQAAGNTSAAVSIATAQTEGEFSHAFGQQTDVAGAMSTVQGALQSALGGLQGNGPATNATGGSDADAKGAIAGCGIDELSRDAAESRAMEQYHEWPASMVVDT